MSDSRKDARGGHHHRHRDLWSRRPMAHHRPCRWSKTTCHRMERRAADRALRRELAEEEKT